MILLSGPMSNPVETAQCATELEPVSIDELSG